MKRLLILVLLGMPAFAQQWSGILSPLRAVNWANVGVPGGIPTGWTVCTTLGTAGQLPTFTQSTTNAQVNSAIQACGFQQVVLLNPGTYNFGSGGGNPGCSGSAPFDGIEFCGKSNVILRGSGADQTLIISNSGAACHGLQASICLDATGTNFPSSPTNTANWTAGYAQGATALTFSSTTNLNTGDVVILDQLDDAADTLTKFNCTGSTPSGGPPPCSLEGNGGNGSRSGRGQSQVVRVVSVVGSTVTITPGLNADNWVSGKSPGAYWATTPISNVGIENLSIDNTAATGARGITIINCNGCWVKGVRDIDSSKSHVEVWISDGVTVRDSYFYLTQNALSQSYGVSPYGSSDLLAENNIFQYVATPLQINGCTGCVFGYNYAINDYYEVAGYVAPALMFHTVGVEYVLGEGNVLPQVYGDVFHGTHNMATLYRNYVIGNQPKCYNGTFHTFAACNNHQTVLIFNSYNREFNVVANVLGQSGVAGAYLNTPSSAGSKAVFDLNFGNTEGSVTVLDDTLVQTTLLRWGNWDVITNATRWCGNSSDTGWSTTCSSTSEIPTGLAQYSNPVPTLGDTGAGQGALPASFYYAVKPSWWPLTKAWPPIGPDVTGGNILGIAGHAYTIPAQDCYLNVMSGPADGTGAVLAFNASTCYASTSGPAVQLTPFIGLSFPSTNVGTTSAGLDATVTNTGTATLNLTAVSIPGDFFNAGTGTCTFPGTIAPSASCTIGVKFLPTFTGTRNSLLCITDDAPASPQCIPISGVGTLAPQLKGTSIFSGLGIVK